MLVKTYTYLKDAAGFIVLYDDRGNCVKDKLGFDSVFANMDAALKYLKHLSKRAKTRGEHTIYRLIVDVGHTIDII